MITTIFLFLTILNSLATSSSFHGGDVGKCIDNQVGIWPDRDAIYSKQSLLGFSWFCYMFLVFPLGGSFWSRQDPFCCTRGLGWRPHRPGSLGDSFHDGLKSIVQYFIIIVHRDFLLPSPRTVPFNTEKKTAQLANYWINIFLGQQLKACFSCWYWYWDSRFTKTWIIATLVRRRLPLLWGSSASTTNVTSSSQPGTTSTTMGLTLPLMSSSMRSGRTSTTTQA